MQDRQKVVNEQKKKTIIWECHVRVALPARDQEEEKKGIPINDGFSLLLAFLLCGLISAQKRGGHQGDEGWERKEGVTHTTYLPNTQKGCAFRKTHRRRPSCHPLRRQTTHREREMAIISSSLPSFVIGACGRTRRNSSAVYVHM